MDTRKVAHVSTLAEVNETTENAKNVVNVVALPPEAGDFGNQKSNVENIADSMKEVFEPAGEPEVEEDFESDKESKRLYHQLGMEICKKTNNDMEIEIKIILMFMVQTKKSARF